MSFAMMFEEVGAEVEVNGSPVRGDHVVFTQAFVDGGKPYTMKGLQQYTPTRVIEEKGASGVVEDITLMSVPANDRAKVRIGTYVHSGVPLHILSVIKCAGKALTDDAADDAARSMQPKVSGNPADDEASDDSRSGFDSYDSRDYTDGDSASDSLDAGPPRDICQELARFAAEAMQFEDCMLDALMASAPPAEAPKVETHAAALESESESQIGDAAQLDALDGGIYEQCAPTWGAPWVR